MFHVWWGWEENPPENPRNPASYVDKREGEVAASGSDLTPKRTNFGDEFGDPMRIEE